MPATPQPGGKVCVFAASSQSCHPDYFAAARRLGICLVDHGFSVIYGGGKVGLMGALADGALSRGGRVVGVLPTFMKDLEWGHPGITELRVVEDMRIRKHHLLAESYAAVALPGGCGTFDELLETITFKRLGLYTLPIVLVNTRRFFDPLLEQLSRVIAEKFMDERHRAMWQVVEEPGAVPAAFKSAVPWSAEARKFATL